MWDHVDRLHALGTLDELFDRPRYVWVRRGAVVRQAVSLWRAMQTQSWRHDSAVAGREPRYSFIALRHLVARLTEQDERWGDLLAGAPVLELTYEELTADLRRAIHRTLAHLGVELPAGRPLTLPTMRRQADELSEAWVAAYARDLEPLTTST
jgi:trehalose 2-sulfotransferase